MVVAVRFNDFVFQQRTIIIAIGFVCICWIYLLFNITSNQYSFNWSIHEFLVNNANLCASIYWTNNYSFIKRKQWVFIFWKPQAMKHFYIVYILPPLINVYGKIFSIGEIIASGYATFFSTGIGMTTFVDFTKFFHPVPCKWFSPKNSFTIFSSLDSVGSGYAKDRPN